MEKPIEKAQVLLGRRIRFLRKAKKWTLEELGERSETNYKHIGEVERGQQNPSYAVLVKIAGGLGVELPELFRFATDGPNREEIVRRISSILESMSDEDLGRMLSVLKILFPISYRSQR
jgi:transcriptional regulator with XRE-family HTH domain